MEAGKIMREKGVMLLKYTKEHLIVYCRNEGMRIFRSGKIKYPRIYEGVRIIKMPRNCTQSIKHIISF